MLNYARAHPGYLWWFPVVAAPMAIFAEGPIWINVVAGLAMAVPIYLTDMWVDWMKIGERSALPRRSSALEPALLVAAFVLLASLNIALAAAAGIAIYYILRPFMS